MLSAIALWLIVFALVRGLFAPIRVRRRRGLLHPLLGLWLFSRIMARETETAEEEGPEGYGAPEMLDSGYDPAACDQLAEPENTVIYTDGSVR